MCISLKRVFFGLFIFLALPAIVLAEQFPIKCEFANQDCPIGFDWIVTDSNFESSIGLHLFYHIKTTFVDSAGNIRTPEYLDFDNCGYKGPSQKLKLNKMKFGNKEWNSEYKAYLLPFDSASKRLSQLCSSDWTGVTWAAETNSRFGHNREADFYLFYPGETKPFLWFHAWDSFKGNPCSVRDEEGISALACVNEKLMRLKMIMQIRRSEKGGIFEDYESELLRKFNRKRYLNKVVAYCKSNYIDLYNKNANWPQVSLKWCEMEMLSNKHLAFFKLVDCFEATKNFYQCEVPDEALPINEYREEVKRLKRLK